MLPVHTLQSMTEAAMAIQACVTNGSFDHKRAERLSAQLYKDAQDLVRAEWNNKPLFPEVITPVAVNLDMIVSDPQLHQLDSLHRPLSKAYRVFIELSWCQCWRQGDRPIASEKIDDLVNHSNQMLSLLPKKQFISRFEYSCARQAARFLNPTESIWTKYLALMPKAAGAGISLSIGEILDVLKDLAGFAKRDWIKGWYPEVHHLRWLSTNVTTVVDFVNNISPLLQLYEVRGGKYSQCVAAICIELIENPNIDIQCRKRAADELNKLLTLRDQDRVSRLLEYLHTKLPKVKTIAQLVRKADRFFKTREMVMSFLKEVKEHEHLQTCRPILREGIQLMSISSSPALTQLEKAQLAKSLSEMRDENDTSREYLEGLRLQLEETRGSDEPIKVAETQGKIEVEQASLARREEEIKLLQIFNEPQSLEEIYNQEEQQFKELIQNL